MTGARSGRRTQGGPDYQFETGPNLADRADLDVHKTQRERQFPDRVLGDIGGHFRGLLGPGDPHRGIGFDLLPQAGQMPLKFGGHRDEQVDDLRVRVNGGRKNDTLRQGRQPFLVIRRGINGDRARVRFN